MTYKSFLIWTISLTAVFCFILGVFNYIIDPLQFYRQANFYKPSFSTEQRYQNPGLARNWEYDTIIIGSSMTENFVPSEVDKGLGGKTIKLSMSGASAHEERMITDLAINTGQVKRVLLGLDYGSLKGNPDRVRDETTPFPYYLYDKKLYNDYSYLFSMNTLTSSLGIVKNMVQGPTPENADLDYLNNWHGQAHYGRDVLLKQWSDEQEQRKDGKKLYNQYDWSYETMAESFDQNILPLIQGHPEIEYLIYFPPYSILRYKSLMLDDPQMIEEEFRVKQHIREKLKTCPNVQVYDFQADSALTFNLDQYKDYSHHSIQYNRYILQAIAENDPRYQIVDNNDLNKGIEILRSQIKTY